MKTDYYEILEISRTASDAEIKSAYRKMALKYHPDRNPSLEAEEMFKAASEAYEVLCDPQKRSIYDQFGRAGLDGQGFHHGFSDVGDIFSHFSDVFEDFFGFSGGRSRGGGRVRPRRGDDLQYSLELSFSEAFHGCEKKIEVQKHQGCETCEGRGYPKGVEPVACGSCGGTGQLYHSQGFFTISAACSACRGQGRVVKEHCEDCRGAGAVLKNKKIAVKFPAGIDNGMQLCLRGEGEAGSHGGPGGDLYVVVKVEEHEQLKREGHDLRLKRKVSMVQAALGAKLEVEGPDAAQVVEIPAGSQTGTVFRLKGKGMPHLKSHHRGDLLVELFVETPVSLTEQQKKILREFEGDRADDSGTADGSSFTKSPKNPKKPKPKSWF